MPTAPAYLTSARAAARLGTSTKALRLYEARGLLAPQRSAKGWRLYAAEDLRRAGEIAGLRAIGLGLGEIGTMLDGDAPRRAAVLAGHARRLERQQRSTAAVIAQVQVPADEPAIAFDLPWPWDGERFALPRIAPLTFITGPLGSGKTRLAMRLAEAIPGATFLPLDRPAATLRELMAMLDTPAPALVVDMIEQGQSEADQRMLAARLRDRPAEAAPLFLMTRSSAILDLDRTDPATPIIYCPANHGQPLLVAATPGTPGYEAVATCLATPDVRARTAGLYVARSIAA